MSAPMGQPSACGRCGVPLLEHMQRWKKAESGAGWHQWIAPSQAQILERMKARRLGRAVAKQGALPMPVGPAPQASAPKPRTMLDRGREALNARMSKDDLRLVLENVITYAASLEVRVSELEAARQADHETWQHDLASARAEREAWAASKDQPAPLIVPDADVDTLPAWLYQRFMPDGGGWDDLDDAQREYWVHQARAVGRAVARGGFKSAAGDR